MEQVKTTLRNLSIRDFWYDPAQEIEITIRVFVCLSLASLLIFPVLALSLTGVEGASAVVPTLVMQLPLQLGITLFTLVATVVGLKMRSEYGWLALVVLCGRSLFSVYFPMGIFFLWWCLRPKFRAHFQLERLK